MPYWNDISAIRKNFVIGDKSLNGFEHNVLFRNDHGRFTEIGHAAGCDSVYDSRGVVFADLDEDGDPDFTVTALRKPVVSFDNLVGNNNHFLQVRLQAQAPGNREAVGARVKILSGERQQIREVSLGSAFLSQQSPWMSFGLGQSTQVDYLEVEWPAQKDADGKTKRNIQTFRDVPGDGILTLREGDDHYVFRSIGPQRKDAPKKSASLASLTTLKGKPASLTDYRGQVVVANFWATWCEPCRKEIPDLKALHQAWKEKGVTVLGINVEQNAPERVSQKIWETGIDYPVLLAGEPFLRQFGQVQAIPTTVVFDKSGKERFRQAGPIEPKQIASLLEKLQSE